MLGISSGSIIVRRSILGKSQVSSKRNAGRYGSLIYLLLFRYATFLLELLSLSLVWKAVKELLKHLQVREDNSLADPSPPQSKQTYFLQIKYVAVGVYDA